MLGKWMSAAMVVGSMVGSGIYLLPTTLAPYGANIVTAFLLTGFGTMCLALALARLAAKIPGGPFAYVDHAFGETAAFVTLWCYTFSQVTGVGGVAIAVAGALGHVYPAVVSGPPLIAVALGSIVALLLVNLRGTRSAGALQIVTVLIKLLPLLAVIALVLARFGSGQRLESLAPVPLSLAGVTAAAALILFSLTGFEGAAMTARVTRDSTTTVPRATILGTGFTAVMYLLATVATLMLLPSAVAAKSGAPFADAIGPLLGNAAGILVAFIAAVSAFRASSHNMNALGLCARQQAGRAGRRPNDLLGGSGLDRPCQHVQELRQRLCLHHAGFDRSRACPLHRLRGGRAQAARRWEVDGSRRNRRSLFDRDVRRLGTERAALGRRDCHRRPSGPHYLALAERLQPAGGGESSRASGMSRRSLCAKLLRHTSLVPSGPAT